MTPFFSVIIPVYNTEKYVSETIQSVINQSYTDWELILVDDGSTDNSGKICDSYLGDTRIQTYHTKNQGSLTARYQGIKKSSGDYILLFDSDDRIKDDCLSRVKETIDATQADMIMWGYHLIGKKGDSYVTCSLEPGKIYSQKEIMYACINETYHGGHLRAFKGNILRQNCSFPQKKLTMNTDYALLIPFLCKIQNGYVMDDYLYEYRVRDDSISHVPSVQAIIDTDYVSEYAIEHTKKNNIYDEDIERAIYISYLKMISRRLFILLYYKAITRADYNRIHHLTVYTSSELYEKKEYFGITEYTLLRHLRKRRYWVLPFIGVYVRMAGEI